MDAVLTLVQAEVNDDRFILLGEKKTSLFAGKIVLPGGKNESIKHRWETPSVCASRELEEETGMLVAEESWVLMGGLMVDRIDKTVNGYSFINDEIQIDLICNRGTYPVLPNLRDSEELRPFWTPQDEIPYNRMPEDYAQWLPEALRVIDTTPKGLIVAIIQNQMDGTNIACSTFASQS